MKRIKSNFPVYISYNFTKGFGIVVNINITRVRLKVQCLISIPSHSGKSCGTCFVRPGIVFHRLSFYAFLSYCVTGWDFNLDYLGSCTRSWFTCHLYRSCGEGFSNYWTKVKTKSWMNLFLKKANVANTNFKNKKYSTHFGFGEFYTIKHDNIRKLNICKSKAHLLNNILQINLFNLFKCWRSSGTFQYSTQVK